MFLIVIYSLLLLSCIGAFIVLIIYKIKGKKNKTSMQVASGYEQNILKILPFLKYDELHECFMYQDNSYMDLVQIITSDLQNASDDEILWQKLKFEKLYKSYAYDLKFIATNFPSDTSPQQAYIQHKIDTTKNQVHKKLLYQKLEEAKWIEQKRTSREFYVMFWSEDVEKLIKDRNQLTEILGVSRLCSFMSPEKKFAVIRKLNNKNSQILRRE